MTHKKSRTGRYSCALAATALGMASIAWAGAARQGSFDGSSAADWPGFGRTQGEQHFSPLDQINETNVGELGLAWFADLGPGPSMTEPVEAEGILYVANRHNEIHAFDASTGQHLWMHDTHAAERAGDRMRVSWGTRGIACWQGKVYVGTTDGRLIALNGHSGHQIWSVQTLQPGDVRYITGAPRIFDGKVIIGHGGADSGPTRGYVTTYDAQTGKRLWRFFTVPGQPGVDTDQTTRLAGKSWAGEWWKLGGGGTVWNAMAYDRATGTVFLGTGNGYPWNYRVRSLGKGDNLFLSSIVALDGRTGRYKWHYQTNPAESWDYNAAMDIELADLTINGKRQHVLMTAPKNGFFYVINRDTGKLISARPFADKITWASRIDEVSGRPVENPAARFPNGSSFDMWPGFVGAHSWLPMAFSPKTGLVYLPTIETGATYTDAGIDLQHWAPPKGNVADGAVLADFTNADKPDAARRSYLQAYDPVTQRRVWQIPSPGPISGGVAATAGGLVFQGDITGNFMAISASTGKVLWKYNAGSPVLAPPIVFAMHGREFVSVVTGNGASFGTYSSITSQTIDYRTQAHHVLTFALGRHATRERPASEALAPPADPEYRPDAASIDRGSTIFNVRCALCHGYNVTGAGTAPDLRASVVPIDADAIRAVVLQGALVTNGMPKFGDLNDRDVEDLRQYIRNAALVWRKTMSAPR